MQFAIHERKSNAASQPRRLKIDLGKDTEVGQRQHLRAKDAK
jgi:hypothetical protein